MAKTTRILLISLLTLIGWGQVASTSGLFARPTTATTDELSIPEIVQKCGPSVANLRGHAGTGTAFVVHDNILVTNRHVIENEFEEDIRLTFPSVGEARPMEFPAELLYVDHDSDLAFLRIEEARTPIRLLEQYEFRAGESAVVIGNTGLPGQNANNHMTSPGIISARAESDNQLFLLEANVYPGHSGSPVLNQSGQAIGIITARVDQRGSHAVCIPCEEANRILRSVIGLSAEEIGRNSSRHRAQVLARRLHDRYMILLAITELYELVAHRAAEAGIPPMDAVEVFSDEIDFVKLESQTTQPFQGLRSNLRQIARDDQVSPAVVEQLVQFWETGNAVRSHLASPAGSWNEFHSALEEQFRRAESLGYSLEIRLGIELEMLEETR